MGGAILLRDERAPDPHPRVAGTTTPAVSPAPRAVRARTSPPAHTEVWRAYGGH
ncbi:hypothetical protein QJS66_15905 [Kocuria rhizophila]|nr:hypothetical protein QJS66_15905 [Kocuria rhizophila]